MSEFSDYTELRETTVDDANALLKEGWHLLSIAHLAKPRVKPDSQQVYVSKYVRYVMGFYNPVMWSLPKEEEPASAGR